MTRAIGTARFKGFNFLNVGSGETRVVRQAPARQREAEMDAVQAAAPHRCRLWQPRYPGQASCGPEALRPRLATGLPMQNFVRRIIGPERASGSRGLRLLPEV